MALFLYVCRKRTYSVYNYAENYAAVMALDSTLSKINQITNRIYRTDNLNGLSQPVGYKNYYDVEFKKV